MTIRALAGYLLLTIAIWLLLPADTTAREPKPAEAPKAQQRKVTNMTNRSDWQ